VNRPRFPLRFVGPDTSAGQGLPAGQGTTRGSQLGRYQLNDKGAMGAIRGLTGWEGLIVDRISCVYKYQLVSQVE